MNGGLLPTRQTQSRHCDRTLRFEVYNILGLGLIGLHYISLINSRKKGLGINGVSTPLKKELKRRDIAKELVQLQSLTSLKDQVSSDINNLNWFLNRRLLFSFKTKAIVNRQGKVLSVIVIVIVFRT